MSPYLCRSLFGTASHTACITQEVQLSGSEQQRATGATRRIALIDWTQTIEDFLDNLGVTLEQFCSEMTGGWMFGYIHALRTANIDTTLFCFSRSHSTAVERVHAPTGARIRILPVPAAYRSLRRRILNPYASTVEEAAGSVTGLERAWCQLLLSSGAYLATPLQTLGKLIQRDGCEAILCQEYENPRFDLAVVLGRRIGVPVFATFQGGDARTTRIERLIRPITLRRCGGLVVGPRAERDRLARTQAIASSRVHAINNPIDRSMWPTIERSTARRALDIGDSAQVVAWHGRLNWHRKGLDLLLDAWRELCAARPNEPEVLLLMGTGGDAQRLRDAMAVIPHGRVRWIDRYVNDRREISQFLHAADIYAFPSRHEGMPVAPLEAMMCGLPVVACRAPGIDDILGVDDRYGGLLVDSGDAVALANALQQLLDDPARRQVLAQAARRRIEESFAAEVVGHQLATVLFNSTVREKTMASLATRQ